MMKRLLIRLGLSRDPGQRWVDDLLAPLREARAGEDIAASVMARVRAGDPVIAFALPSRRTGRVWMLVAASTGFLVLVGATLALIAGGQGFYELWNVATALGRFAWVIVGAVLQFFGRLLSTSAPLGRGAWLLLEGVAPILRGAGLVAAVWGLLSILFSTYVFAQARRNSSAGPHGGLR